MKKSSTTNPAKPTKGKYSKDLTGQTFGWWRVIAEAPKKHNNNRRWVCICRCGTEKQIEGHSLKKGDSRSCGCRNRKHGRHGTPEYWTWKSMLKRCATDPYYIDRIAVCERWRNSLEAFLEDMGPRPSNKHSLDRINNNKDYSPDNCRWATWGQQGRNKRSNRLLTFEGKTQPVAAWAEELGINQHVLYTRLHRGWSIERTLSTPLS